MRLISELAGLVAIAIIVVVMFALLVLEMVAKVAHWTDKAPWLKFLLEKREMHGSLLLVCVLLLATEGYELFTKETPELPAPPVLKIVAPLAPQVTVQSHSAVQKIIVPAPTDGIQVTDLRKFHNDDPNAPYGLEVTIETDRERQPVGIWIQCDAEMDKGSYAKLPAGHSYEGVNVPGRVDLHWDTLGIKWKSPAWKPHEPIVAHIVSANPIELKRAVYNIPRF